MQFLPSNVVGRRSPEPRPLFVGKMLVYGDGLERERQAPDQAGLFWICVGGIVLVLLMLTVAFIAMTIS
jgi:hypothetical protein